MHASGEHVRKGPQAVDFRSALQFYLIDCTTLPGKLIDILIVFFNMEWIHIARKRDIVCPQCGLRYHDDDASHCKSCGHVIFQEYDGG
jgi:ribosomal protein S27AE